MGSFFDGKLSTVAWIKERFPQDATILDVGACDGTWRRLLEEYPNIDAVEIFPRYAKKLRGYRAVYNVDIADFEYDHYDLIIFGDVIEHMTVEAAQKTLTYAAPRCKDLIVAVPYQYVQPEVDGNPWQRHIQDDLTPEIYRERYPEFSASLWNSGYYGYYHKGGANSDNT